MKILVLHTLPPGAAPAGRDAGEFDLSGAAANLADALASSAVVAGVRGDPRELIGLLRGENFGKKLIRVGPEPVRR